MALAFLLALLGSAGAMLGAALLLLFSDALRRRLLPGLLAYATGTLVGDAFHNFVDGVVIAAAFLTSPALGLATALAVIAHQIPQELGDFAILLHSGYGKTRALVLNLISSLATLPGVLVGWFWLAEVRQAVPYVLAVSAASFIYIAMADLVPTLHRRNDGRAFAGQALLILAGIGTIALFRFAH